jgi:hypothetical protein
MTIKNDAMVQIGWAWRKEVYLIKHKKLGWVALLENQTHENLHV